MKLSEAMRRDPRLLLLRCDDGLQTSLERNTPHVPCDDRFHVRVRGRIIFSGCYAEAQARYERAWEAQHLRQRADRLLEATARQRLCPPTGVRVLPCARRSDGRYAGQRRLSWRALVPLRSPFPRQEMPLLILEAPPEPGDGFLGEQ
jgi:hypothetical protein